jgi:cytochrome P450
MQDPAAIADPYPHYAAIREAGDVVWDDDNQAWLVASDRMCRTIMKDFRRYGMRGTTADDLFGEDAFIIIDDRKRHDALRGIWDPAFRPSALLRLKDSIAAMVDNLLLPMSQRLRDGETVDAVEAFCRDLPVLVICEMFGVAESVRPEVIRWSDDMIGALMAQGDRSNPAHIKGEDAKRAMADFIQDEIKARRASPSDDLIGLIANSPLAASLSAETIMYNCRQLLFAGNETTTRWLAQAIHILATRPDDRAGLVADLSRVPAVMEEVMRYDPVAQVLPRRVAEGPIELDGKEIADGDLVLLLVASANRDAKRWDRPDVFDVRRDVQGHLGFGFGLHHCLGAPLARVEVAVAMPRLLAAIPDYTLDGPVAYSNFHARSPDAVPIRLG